MLRLNQAEFITLLARSMCLSRLGLQRVIVLFVLVVLVQLFSPRRGGVILDVPNSGVSSLLHVTRRYRLTLGTWQFVQHPSS